MINIISAISAMGILIGSAALVIILSINNGFGEFVTGIYGKYEADILISPKDTKTFIAGEDLIDYISKNKDINYICPIIQDRVFLDYKGRQGIGLLRGVDSLYSIAHNAKSSISEGDFSLSFGEINYAIIGQGLSSSMGIRPRFVAPVELYYPAKGKQVSLSNPLASLNRVNLFPQGVISINQELDKDIIICSAQVAKQLLDFKEKEYSYIELILAPQSKGDKLKAELEEKFGDSYRFLNRFQQNETIYKMMKYEKAAIFSILTLIILIIAINIFGSLTMLIIEKKNDIKTLRNIGADSKLIRNIFVIEGWLICLLGNSVGIILGVVVSLIQQKFGILKMPGSYLINSYPVVVEPSDVLLTFVIISGIGLIISLIPVIKVLPVIKEEQY